MKGRVKFFNVRKGFGFLLGEDQKDYFVHISDIGDTKLEDNAEVTFEVEDAARGPKAVNIQLV